MDLPLIFPCRRIARGAHRDVLAAVAVHVEAGSDHGPEVVTRQATVEVSAGVGSGEPSATISEPKKM